MKLSWSLLLAAAAVATAQLTPAQEAAEAVQVLGHMPKCGLACLQAAIAASPCSATDLSCSCTNETLTAQVTLCVAESCTVREQLTTRNTSDILCHRPVRDRTHAVSYSGVIGMVIALIAYLVRMASKITFSGGIQNTLWWDDAIMTVGVILIIPISAMSVVLADLGLGKDIWTIPFPNITRILEIYYADEILYLTALPAVKIAMLLTFMRIFQSDRFRYLAYGAMALNVAYAITFVTVTVFQCTPINLAWLRWDNETPGKCNNINAQGWASAATNIVLDIIVIGLPLPQLWKMQLNNRKKFWVMVMFSTGFFVTIVSILRLQILIDFGSTHNLTWDYTSVGYWSTIECHAAIVAACMPAIRNFVRRYMPKLMGQTSGEASFGPNASGLSGRTAVSSGIGKYEPEVFVRPRDDDEEDFIPLREIGTGGGEDEIRRVGGRKRASVGFDFGGGKGNRF